MIRRWLIAAALAALVSPAQAHGRQPCEAEIQPPPAAVYNGADGSGYQVFGSNAAEPVPITIQHRGDACDYALTVTGPDEAGFGLAGHGGETLRFSLSDQRPGRQLVSRSPSPGADAARGMLLPSAQGDLHPADLHISAPDGQLVAPGAYEANLRLRLYVDRGAGWEFAHETGLLAVVPVAAAIDLGFAPSGADSDTQDLSLSVGAGGGEARTMLYARSNAAFTATVETENDFSMQRTDGLSQAALDYALSLAGRRIDTGSLRFARPAGLESEIPVLVSVGAQRSTPPAGVYRDTVRITVTAE